MMVPISVVEKVILPDNPRLLSQAVYKVGLSQRDEVRFLQVTASTLILPV